jgi:glucose/arabinose dehydrogenase
MIQLKHCISACLIIGAAFTTVTSFGADQSSTTGEYGPTPVLLAPEKSLIPMVNVAKAVPWQGDAMLRPAPGLRVAALERDLQHPRWLYVLPNGDVLVAESDAPPKPDDAKGLSGKVHKAVKHAGSGGMPSANRITLLRDPTGDPG